MIISIHAKKKAFDKPQHSLIVKILSKVEIQLTQLDKEHLPKNNDDKLQLISH